MPAWIEHQTLEPVPRKPIEILSEEAAAGITQPLGNDVTISPAGTFIASCVYGDGATRFWRRGDDGAYKQIEIDVPRLDIIVHWSGRGEHEFLAVGTIDLEIYRLDLKSRKSAKLRLKHGHKGEVCSLLISPNGRYCLTWSWWWNVRVFDLEATTCIWSGFASKYSVALSDEYFVTENERIELDDGTTEDWQWDDEPMEDPESLITTIGYDLRIHQLSTGKILYRVSRPASLPDRTHPICFFLNSTSIVYQIPTDEGDLSSQLICQQIGQDNSQLIELKELAVAVPLEEKKVIGGTETGRLVLADFATSTVEYLETGLEIKENILSISADRNGQVMFCSRDGVMAVGHLE